MMSRVDIAREAFNLNDPDRAESHLADDFQATDEVGSPPFDKTSWIGMGHMLRAAFPDIDFIIEDIWEEGNEVMITGHFAGTFTYDLDLSPMGMGVIPANGQAIVWPDSTNIVSFAGDKVVHSHDTSTGPDAGMAGFFKPLGVDMG